MIHGPTFVINETPGCLAFSMCTIGGPRRAGARVPWDNVPLLHDTSADGAWEQLRTPGKIVAERPTNVGLIEPESSEEDGWDQIKSVVKREKTDMLIKVS